MLIKFSLAILSSILISRPGSSVNLNDVYAVYVYFMKKQTISGDRPLAANLFRFVIETFVRTAFIGSGETNPDAIMFETRTNASPKITNITFLNQYPLLILQQLQTRGGQTGETVNRLNYLYACMILDLRKFFNRDPLVLLFPELASTKDEELLEIIRQYEAGDNKNANIKVPLLQPMFEEYKSSKTDAYSENPAFTKTTQQLNQDAQNPNPNPNDDDDDGGGSSDDDASEIDDRDVIVLDIKGLAVELEKNGCSNQSLLDRVKKSTAEPDSYSITDLKSIKASAAKSNSNLQKSARTKRQNNKNKKKTKQS